MAEPNKKSTVLFPSHKKRKYSDHDDTLSMGSLVIPELDLQYTASEETIICAQTYDYDEDTSVTQHQTPLVDQYCFQLMTSSQLWYLEDTDLVLLSEFSINAGRCRHRIFSIHDNKLVDFF